MIENDKLKTVEYRISDLIFIKRRKSKMAKKEYFTIRLNKIKVLNDRELGAAEVKIFSFLTTGNESLPSLEGYMNANSEAEKLTFIKKAASEFISYKEIIEVQHVKDDCILTFSDVGMSVYTANKIPIDFNWLLVLIERDKKIRDLGMQIEGLLSTPEFDTFANNLLGLTMNIPKPEITIAFKIGKFIGTQFAKILTNNKDDQIGIFVTSLNKFEHYLHGERKRNDVRGINGNIFVDYTIFGTRYKVRNG